MSKHSLTLRHSKISLQNCCNESHAWAPTPWSLSLVKTTSRGDFEVSTPTVIIFSSVASPTPRLGTFATLLKEKKSFGFATRRK